MTPAPTPAPNTAELPAFADLGGSSSTTVTAISRSCILVLALGFFYQFAKKKEDHGDTRINPHTKKKEEKDKSEAAGDGNVEIRAVLSNGSPYKAQVGSLPSKSDSTKKHPHHQNLHLITKILK